MQWLKRFRVIVAIIFSIAITIIFLDYLSVIPSNYVAFLTSLQLAPNLMRTLVILTSASFGLLFVIILTFLFGRVYCSTLCPLGVLQDVIIRFANIRKRKNRFRFRKQYYLLHYSLFALIVILALAGSIVLLNLLEPFSNYGRIVANLLSPLVVSLNNGFEYIFDHLEIMSLFHIQIIYVSAMSAISAGLFLLVIVYLSYNHGRLFCNTLCPVGALLSILSRFTIFKIIIDVNNCKECGLCEKVCKASCINSNNKEIDFAACVGCFNCISACPTVGISYDARKKKIHTTEININKSRRSVMKIFALPTFGITFSKIFNDVLENPKNESGYLETHKHPISPPGSLSVERFASLCTACHLCVSSCPTQVLYPSLLEYGIAGLFQPRLNFDLNYCNYDCIICSQICPSGAILPIDINTKKEIQIGKVEFFKPDCIVVTKGRDCGACSEHCPTKAVKMVPYKKYLMIPEIEIDLCVGCGACQYACPVLPNKAIYVNTNTIHQKARIPEVIKAKSTINETNEFPF